MLNPNITRTQVREAYAALVTLAEQWQAYDADDRRHDAERVAYRLCAEDLDGVLARLEQP